MTHSITARNLIKEEFSKQHEINSDQDTRESAGQYKVNVKCTTVVNSFISHIYCFYQAKNIRIYVVDK